MARATVPAPHLEGRCAGRAQDRALGSAPRVCGAGLSQTGSVDEGAPGAHQRRIDWRRGRIRFPCRDGEARAALDAAWRSRVALSARLRAAAAMAPLFGHQYAILRVLAERADRSPAWTAVLLIAI